MNWLIILALGAAEPALDCKNPVTQSDMNRCAYQDFQQADAELNRVWKKVSATMKGRDKEMDRASDQRPGYHETLLAGQRAWLIYRDQHCTLAGFEMRGGSAEPLVRESCRASVTTARTR